MNLNNVLNEKYDKIEEPWRFLVALLLCSLGIILLGTKYNTLGATWMLILIASRIVHKTRFPKT